MRITTTCIRKPIFEARPRRRRSGGWVLLLATALLQTSFAMEASASEQSGSQGTSGQRGEGSGPATEESELSARIASLITQLGDPNFHQRLSAQSELMAIGLPAFEQLRLAGNLTPNPEVARAARYLLDSQQVRWSLDTDSIVVRDIVEHYNVLDQEGRRTRFNQLAQVGADDALLALVRFARFESDELLSKFAALSLMEKLTTTAVQTRTAPADSTERAVFRELLGEILDASKDRPRKSCMWIERCCDEVQQLLGGRLPDASLGASPWGPFAEELTADVATEQRESRALAKRFHYWMGRWMTETRDRPTAVEASRPLITLVKSKGTHVKLRETDLIEVCKWLLDGQLPELLVELGQQQTEQFSQSPRLGFLLAEAFIKQGDASKANRQAKETSQRIGENARQQMRSLNASYDVLRLEAYRRSDIADGLKSRGMYDWSENELQTAIEILAKSRQAKKEAGEVGGDLPSDMEMHTRFELSQFYWEAGKNEQAAATLRQVELLYASDQFREDTSTTRSDVGTLYNFYAGLDSIDKGQVEAASEFLLKAMEFENQIPNPDIVIAYRKIAESEPYATKYAEILESMADHYRQQLLAFERRLASAQTRQDQRTIRREVAQSCNVLAWLLACCETDTEEALQLSRRAVELDPGQSAYMDTLARSLYAAGKIDAAIQMQQDALALDPHEMQYKSQLYLFIEQRDKAKASNDS